MIESFTMWRVKDKEFSDYAEAVKYENTINAATSDIEFFDHNGQPLSFEQAQEKEFETADFVHIKSKEALNHFQKCLEDFGADAHPDSVGWNRYDYDDFEWKAFEEEKRIFNSHWEKVSGRIKEG